MLVVVVVNSVSFVMGHTMRFSCVKIVVMMVMMVMMMMLVWLPLRMFALRTHMMPTVTEHSVMVSAFVQQIAPTAIPHRHHLERYIMLYFSSLTSCCPSLTYTLEILQLASNFNSQSSSWSVKQSSLSPFRQLMLLTNHHQPQEGPEAPSSSSSSSFALVTAELSSVSQDKGVLTTNRTTVNVYPTSTSKILNRPNEMNAVGTRVPV